MSEDKPQASTHLILHSQQQRCLRQAAPTPSQHHHSTSEQEHSRLEQEYSHLKQEHSRLERETSSSEHETWI
ncbi:MAG: hypothetical protein ACRAVC_03410 [Trichormus sp.]